jgi:hypothetical protein
MGKYHSFNKEYHKPVYKALSEFNNKQLAELCNTISDTIRLNEPDIKKIMVCKFEKLMGVNGLEFHLKSMYIKNNLSPITHVLLYANEDKMSGHVPYHSDIYDVILDYYKIHRRKNILSKISSEEE